MNKYISIFLMKNDINDIYAACTSKSYKYKCNLTKHGYKTVFE